MGTDEAWQRMEERLLRFPPVVLSVEQRVRGEAMLPGICERGGWTCHAAACRADHVHVLLSAAVEGKKVRRWLKAWLGQAMSEHWALPEGATWWAECGSVKWAWDEGYFQNILEYVKGQRTTGRARQSR